MTIPYTLETLSRDEADRLAGASVIDFGTNWCGHCQRAQPLVDEAFQANPELRHVKVEDGAGRQLGRRYGVKLWPTLIFLRDGREVARVVRPVESAPVVSALAELAGTA